MDKKIKYIDFHAHAFADKVEEKAVKFLGDYYNFIMPNKGTIEALAQSAENSGQDAHLVVHATATKPSQVETVNTWIAGAIKKYGNMAGFGTLHIGYGNFEKEINRIISLGLCGIKLHPDFQQFNIDDPDMFSIYECIGERLPILFHTGDENVTYSSPQRLAKVLEMFPKMKAIAAHLGGYTVWDEAVGFLADKNVFVDTSSVMHRLSPEKTVSLIKAYGVERVLFGTDYPIITHREELNKFLDLKLSDSEKEKILWENACRLLPKGIFS